MEFDLDYTKPLDKSPFYVAVGILALWFLASTPLIDEIRNGSCTYIEYLNTLYYDFLGFSEGFIEKSSDYLGFFILDYFLGFFLVFSDNKYLALLLFISIKAKGVIPQMLKPTFQDSRPAWTCTNFDIDYCMVSFGMPATHVMEGTVGWLTMLYFGFVHVGFFNRNNRVIWVQAIRYTGIAICIFCIWFVHQTRLIIAAHYLYQDYYGFIGGCVYFYAVYYFFLPWAMNPSRRFYFEEMWKLVAPTLIITTIITWTMFGFSRLGFDRLEDTDGMLENISVDCGIHGETLVQNVVKFDYSNVGYFPYAIIMLYTLPFKDYLPKGFAWKWSLVLAPLLIVSNIYVLDKNPTNWIEWTPTIYFVLGFYAFTLWFVVFETLPFALLILLHKVFDKEQIKQEI